MKDLPPPTSHLSSCLPCISIKQPWAHLILHGTIDGRIKDVENRTWATAYRGPLLIHAAKTRDPDCPETTSRAAPIVSGAIIGAVILYDCTQTHHSSWHHAGCWGFYLSDPTPFAVPVPYRGQLGIFDVDLASVVPGKAAWMWDVDLLPLYAAMSPRVRTEHEKWKARRMTPAKEQAA
jgi:hypothetical protein